MAIEEEKIHGGGMSRKRAVQPLRGYFDLEWEPPEAKLRNTVLLPVLGDHYGRVLRRANCD
jgi:maltooligosyltrehalose synthase